jgi:hypothetical protein
MAHCSRFGGLPLLTAYFAVHLARDPGAGDPCASRPSSIEQLSFLLNGKSLVEDQPGALIFALKQGAISNLMTVGEGNRGTE